MNEIIENYLSNIDKEYINVLSDEEIIREYNAFLDYLDSLTRMATARAIEPRASSGSFNTSGYTTSAGTPYYFRFSWSTKSQSIDNNTSTITWNVTAQGGQTSGRWNTSYGGTVKVNGKSYSIKTGTIYNGTVVASGELTISHNADGSKSFSASIDANIYSSGSSGDTKGSGTFTLNTIPRASTPTLSASSVQMGGTVTIYTNRASTAFTHTIKFTFGSYSTTVATGVGASYTYDIQTAMASYVPNATSGQGTFMVDTYSNGNLIGSKSVNITLTVPSSIVPSISGANMTETGTGLGIYVQSRSQIKVKITAGGAYGSSITDYSTTFEGVTYKGAEFTTNTISGSGDIDLVVTVKDSRGRTATYTRTASVYAYSKATVSKFEAFRCDASGVAEDGGSYVKITYSFNITPLDNKNGHAVTIQYKRSTATSWTNLTTDGGYSATDKTYLSGAIFDPSYTYDLRIVVQDSFTSDNPQIQIDTESVTVSYLDGGQGMGIGKVAELENTLDVAWLGKFRNGLEVDDMDVVKQEKGQNVQILFEGSGYLGFYNCPQGYLRAPTNGLIPNVQNSSSGSGKLGTSTWKWNTLYAYYGYIDRLMNSLLYNCFVPNNANLNAKRSDGTSRRFLTMLTNNQMYICYDGDTCHFGGDVDIPTYLIANTYRFHSQWIGIYGSHNDAINSTNRKGWIGFDSSKDLTIKNEYNNGYVVLYAGNTSNPGGIKLQSGVNVCYLEGEDVSSPAFRPQAADTGVLYLGVSSAKWRAVYATNGTIQTSDRRVKHDINTLEDRYINLFKLLKPVSYVLNDGKRTHVGFISQDIEEAMQEVGLSDLEFAGFCKDIKQTENDQGKLEDVLDENGNPEYEYSLRYEEFIALNTRMIQDLMKTVEEQNKRIEALEAEIKSIKELK